MDNSDSPIFALFDTETTGLPLHPLASLIKQPRIIEFGLLLTDGFSILDEFNFLCDPGIALEAIITKLTGISDSQLIGQPPFQHFVPQIKERLAKANFVFAHNMAFDQQLLEMELNRHDLGLEDIDWPYAVCTLEETRPMFGYGPKLEALHERYVGQVVQTHRAVGDCKMLFEVMKATGIFKAWGAKQ